MIREKQIKTTCMPVKMALIKVNKQPWLVRLSGLSASLRTKQSPVRFSVRAHAWLAGQVPNRGRVRGNHTLIFLSLSSSFPFSLKRNNILKKIEEENSPSFVFGKKGGTINGNQEMRNIDELILCKLNQDF